MISTNEYNLLEEEGVASSAIDHPLQGFHWNEDQSSEDLMGNELNSGDGDEDGSEWADKEARKHSNWLERRGAKFTLLKVVSPRDIVRSILTT